MRILHILHRSLPGTHGYAIRSKEIVVNQKAIGLDPMVVTSPSQAPAGVLDAEGSEMIDSIRYFRTGDSFLPPTIEVFDKSTFQSTLRLFQNVLLFKRSVELTKKYRPAIIHSHSPFTCGLIGDTTGKIMKLPKVYEIRGIWEDSHTSRHGLSQKSIRYQSVRKLETQAAKAADMVVVLGEKLKAEMVERGVDPNNIALVPNGVDVQHFQPGPAPEELRKKLNPDNGLIIGYIGSFFRYEGLDILARAFAQLAPIYPSLKLLLVGDGELADELRAIVKDAGLAHRVIFTGKLKHSEVDDYYKLCDIMVLPRRDTRETRLVTPLKPMEIMSMEKPLIVSDIGGHHEIVEQEKNGIFFRAEDVGDLVSKCRLLMDNEEYRTDLAARGRAWVIQNRDWAVLVKIYKEIYQELTSRRRTH
jgi:PEP-CTERM/exosortase A-associated glycosyltransferase